MKPVSRRHVHEIQGLRSSFHQGYFDKLASIDLYTQTAVLEAPSSPSRAEGLRAEASKHPGAAASYGREDLGRTSKLAQLLDRRARGERVKPRFAPRSERGVSTPIDAWNVVMTGTGCGDNYGHDLTISPNGRLRKM